MFICQSVAPRNSYECTLRKQSFDGCWWRHCCINPAKQAPCSAVVIECNDVTAAGFISLRYCRHSMFTFLTAEESWSRRCVVIHATSFIVGLKVKKVIFYYLKSILKKYFKRAKFKIQIHAKMYLKYYLKYMYFKILPITAHGHWK